MGFSMGNDEIGGEKQQAGRSRDTIVLFKPRSLGASIYAWALTHLSGSAKVVTAVWPPHNLLSKFAHWR